MIHMTVVGPEYDMVQGEYWIGIGEVYQGDLEPWRQMYVAHEYEFIADDDCSPVLPPNWIAGLA
jgi:hypothetical protein